MYLIKFQIQFTLTIEYILCNNQYFKCIDFFPFIGLSVYIQYSSDIEHLMQGHWICSHVDPAQTKTDAPGQTAIHTETGGCKSKQTTADSTVCDCLYARKAVYGLPRVLKAWLSMKRTQRFLFCLSAACCFDFNAVLCKL